MILEYVSVQYYYTVLGFEFLQQQQQNNEEE